MRPTWGSSPGGYPISPSSSATGPDSVSCTAVPTALALALGCPTSGRGLTSPPPRNADQVSADHAHGTFRRRTTDRARTAVILSPFVINAGVAACFGVGIFPAQAL